MYERPYSCSAVTADALKIMTAPSRQSPSVAMNSHLSFSRRLGMPFLRTFWISRNFFRTTFRAFQLMDQFLEDAPPMFVILELIEAGTSGGHEDDVARLRRLRCGFDSVFERAGLLQRNTAFDLLFDLLGRGADQQREDDLCPQEIAQQRVVAVLILSAEDDQDAAREGLKGFQRRIHIGSFGVVVITHSADFRHKLDAMFDACKGLDSRLDLLRTRSGQTSRCYCCQHILKIMGAGKGNLVYGDDPFFLPMMREEDFPVANKCARHNFALAAEADHVKML